MRKTCIPRKLAIIALGIVAAAAFLVPGAPALAATHPATHVTASAPPLTVKLTHVGRAPNAVDPECILFYMNAQGNPGGLAHISSFLLHHHKIRAVKINAEIQCRRVSMNLVLRVTLWKTGLFFPHKQAGPTTATAAKGNQLKNQKTFRQCVNRTSSTFYGTAFASVIFQGVQFTGSLQSGKATLACGT
jgi:hypothetical protein